MKILMNEKSDEKLYNVFQRLIDKELSEIKTRYREEVISASNWYLAVFSPINNVKVLNIKYKPSLSVYIDVYADSGFDEDDVQTFANYLREKLSYAGNPWIVPILVNNKKSINENIEDKLKFLLKRKGPTEAINVMGGWDRFCKIFNLSGPMDFLHLFDGLKKVQSESHKDYTLFRYEEGHNLMIYDKFLKCLYINEEEIWDFLNQYLGVDYYSVDEYIKKWAEDVYNLNLKRTEPLAGSRYIGMV